MYTCTYHIINQLYINYTLKKKKKNIFKTYPTWLKLKTLKEMAAE